MIQSRQGASHYAEDEEPVSVFRLATLTHTVTLVLRDKLVRQICNLEKAVCEDNCRFQKSACLTEDNTRDGDDVQVSNQGGRGG